MAYPPMQFAPASPMQARPNPGMALLQQVQQLQNPGGGAGAGGMPGMPPGLIQQMMQGNAPGLIGALLKNRPWDRAGSPGMAPDAGSPAYVPGGVGPAMPMPAATDMASPAIGGSGMGMLARMLGGMGG